MLGVGPLFSAISDTDAGWDSLATDTQAMGVIALLVLVVLAACIIVAVSWHIYFAYSMQGTKACVTYVVARASVGLVWIVAGVAASMFFSTCMFTISNFIIHLYCRLPRCCCLVAAAS